MESNSTKLAEAEVQIEVVAVDCPLCGSGEYSQVCCISDATYSVAGEYHVVGCVGCGHLYLNPRPADGCLMACYPQRYAPYQASGNSVVGAEPEVTPEYESEVARPLWRRWLRSIPGLRWTLNWLGQEHATHLPVPPKSGESRLLEIGCAHGGFLERARQNGWQVAGVEPSEQACLAARERGLEVFHGLLADSGFESCSRDAIAMWMVLEHVPDPVLVLQETLRILKPGGELALSVPNAGTWERWLFGKYWLGYDAPRHLQMFTARRLRLLLNELGYADIRIQHQANTRYWWGSVAAWGKSRFPNSQWPERWMQYFRSEPPRSWMLPLMIPGKLSSLLRCSGRITVVAAKPSSDSAAV